MGLLNFFWSPPSKEPKTEKERQGQHFRNLQWFTVIANNFHLVLGLTAMGALIVYLPADKYNLVREMVGAVIMAILNEWKSGNAYVTGSSASNFRANEALRTIASEKSGEKVE